MPEDEKKHPGTLVWEKGEENQASKCNMGQ